MKAQDKYSSWSFIAKVSKLELCKAVNFEFKVRCVIFVAPDRLPYRRRRLLGDVPHISKLRSSRLRPMFEHFLDRSDALAVVRRQGQASKLQPELERVVAEELAILSLSQLGYSKRRQGASPAIDLGTGARRENLFLDSDSDIAWLPMRRVDKVLSLRLDDGWKSYHRSSFFPKLLRLFQSEDLSRGWRKELWRASVLVGQSLSSSELPKCFLWNMIALELLLTRSGDTFSDALPARAEAFLGWVTDWSIEDYEATIRKCYKKRCALVHRGQQEEITVSDVLFTDDLLLNLFENIAAHPKLFRSKDSLVSFSEKVKAEHVLGIKPRTRPKSMIFLSRTYSDDDLRAI